MSRQITLAIPTYCRFEMLLESFRDVFHDDRIREIVISDDCSMDGSFEKLLSHFKDFPKVKIYRNKKNLDCYANKRQAVELATSEWVILFDDDNTIRTDYLDVIYDMGEWDPGTLYCPDFAKPHFNYTHLAGKLITRRNVSNYIRIQHCNTALNTANYFFNRQSFLEVWDGSTNPHTADTLYQAYNWLSSGRRIIIVPSLRYLHRVHEGSHYKRNVKKTGNFAKSLEALLRTMR